MSSIKTNSKSPIGQYKLCSGTICKTQTIVKTDGIYTVSTVHNDITGNWSNLMAKWLHAEITCQNKDVRFNNPHCIQQQQSLFRFIVPCAWDHKTTAVKTFGKLHHTRVNSVLNVHVQLVWLLDKTSGPLS